MSLERAIIDMKRHTRAGFSQEIVFTPPVGEPITVRGLVSKHSLGINPETGLPVNSKNAHISVVESVLTDEGYQTRNDNGDVDLRKHLVTWCDASGNRYTYMIEETMPSYTTGLIVCILGDYEDAS
jgi:hypothetical protein